MPCAQVIEADGRNVVPDVWAVLDKIKTFSDKVRYPARLALCLCSRASLQRVFNSVLGGLLFTSHRMLPHTLLAAFSCTLL